MEKVFDEWSSLRRFWLSLPWLWPNLRGSRLTYFLEPLAPGFLFRLLRDTTWRCVKYLWHFSFPSWSGTHLALAREQVAHALTWLVWLELPRYEAEDGLTEDMFKFHRETTDKEEDFSPFASISDGRRRCCCCQAGDLWKEKEWSVVGGSANLDPDLPALAIYRGYLAGEGSIYRGDVLKFWCIQTYLAF